MISILVQLKFDDVYDGKWYSTSLLETTFFGLLNTDDRMFKPNLDITRIEAAKAIKQSFAAKNLGVMMTQIFQFMMMPKI